MGENDLIFKGLGRLGHPDVKFHELKDLDRCTTINKRC
jgi:hypothetical protein